MFPNLSVLRITKIQIVYISLRKFSMDLNKHQGISMRDLATSFLNKSLGEEKLIKTLFIKKFSHSILLVQVIRMTSFLVPLTNLFVKILCTR